MHILSCTMQWCYPKYCHHCVIFTLFVYVDYYQNNQFYIVKIEFLKFCFISTMIFGTLAWTIELYMIKYIIGEIFSSGGATLRKIPSDQTVPTCTVQWTWPKSWRRYYWTHIYSWVTARKQTKFNFTPTAYYGLKRKLPPSLYCWHRNDHLAIVMLA